MSDRVKSLRQEHAEATRAAILAAARSSFAEHGYAAASVDQVAASARVTKGAVYHHFSSKRGLMLAVYEVLAREMEARIRARIAAETDPMARARAALDAFLEHGDDAEVRRVVFRDGPTFLSPDCRAVDDRTFLRLLVELLRDLQSTGAGADLDAELAGRLLLAVLVEGSQVLAHAEDVPATAAGLRAILWRVVGGLLSG